MEKQYSVQFFNSVVSNMQQSCQNFVTFGQLVELSGYLSVEIDGVKKERYVLSELIQTTGNVISESYCTKVSRNCNPGWKPPGPKSPNVINQAAGRASGPPSRPQSGQGVRFADQPVNRTGQRQQAAHRQFQLSRPRQGPQIQSGPQHHVGPQIQSGPQHHVGPQVQIVPQPITQNRLQHQQMNQNSSPDVQIISGPYPSNPVVTVQSGKVNESRAQPPGFRRVKSPVPTAGHQDLRKQSMLRHHINSLKQQGLSEGQGHMDNTSVSSGLKNVSQGRESLGNVKGSTDCYQSPTSNSNAVPFQTQSGSGQIQTQQSVLNQIVNESQDPECSSEPQFSGPDPNINQGVNDSGNNGQSFSRFPNSHNGQEKIQKQNQQSETLNGKQDTFQEPFPVGEAQDVVEGHILNQGKNNSHRPRSNKQIQVVNHLDTNQNWNSQRCQSQSQIEVKDQSRLPIPLGDHSKHTGYSDALPQVSHRQAKFPTVQVTDVRQTNEQIQLQNVCRDHQDVQGQQASLSRSNSPMDRIPKQPHRNTRQRQPSCSVIPTAPVTELQPVPKGIVSSKTVKSEVHKPPVLTLEADLKVEANGRGTPMRTEIYESLPDIRTANLGSISSETDSVSRQSPLQFKTQQAEAIHKTVTPVPEQQDQKLWLKPLPPMESKDETEFCVDRPSNSDDPQIPSFTATTDSTPHGPCVIEMTSQGSSTSEMKVSSERQQHSSSASFRPIPPHEPRFPSPAQIEYAQQLESPLTDSNSAKRQKMSLNAGKNSAPSANQPKGKSRAKKPKEKGRRGKRKSKTPRKSDQMELSSEDEHLHADIPPANRTLRSSRIGPRKSYSEHDDYLSDGITEFLLKDDESNEVKE